MCLLPVSQVLLAATIAANHHNGDLTKLPDARSSGFLPARSYAIVRLEELDGDKLVLLRTIVDGTERKSKDQKYSKLWPDWTQAKHEALGGKPQSWGKFEHWVSLTELMKVFSAITVLDIPPPGRTVQVIPPADAHWCA